MSGAEQEKSFQNPTTHIAKEGTVIYYAMLDDEKLDANKDNWRGLIGADQPIYARYAKETGAKLYPYVSSSETNHFRIDIKPNPSELRNIIKNFSLLYPKGLPNRIWGDSGDLIAQTIADEATEFQHGYSLFEKRSKAIRSVLKLSGYHGTAEPINYQDPVRGMLLSFFEPYKKLEPTN